jgi:hypothetical protein
MRDGPAFGPLGVRCLRHCGRLTPVLDPRGGRPHPWLVWVALHTPRHSNRSALGRLFIPLFCHLGFAPLRYDPHAVFDVACPSILRLRVRAPMRCYILSRLKPHLAQRKGWFGLRPKNSSQNRKSKMRRIKKTVAITCFGIPGVGITWLRLGVVTCSPALRIPRSPSSTA